MHKQRIKDLKQQIYNLSRNHPQNPAAVLWRLELQGKLAMLETPPKKRKVNPYGWNKHYEN